MYQSIKYNELFMTAFGSHHLLGILRYFNIDRSPILYCHYYLHPNSKVSAIDP